LKVSEIMSLLIGASAGVRVKVTLNNARREQNLLLRELVCVPSREVTFEKPESCEPGDATPLVVYKRLAGIEWIGKLDVVMVLNVEVTETSKLLRCLCNFSRRVVELDVRPVSAPTSCAQRCNPGGCASCSGA
jgi:hypothetical protein